MKSPAIFAIISATALVAAAGVFYAPKSPTSGEPRVRAEKVVIKKKMGKPINIGDVDYDYIEAFRKCTSGQKELCQDGTNGRQDGKQVVGAVDPDTLVSSLGGGMKAPVYAPIEFNELMVRTAIKFATRKGGCRGGRPCGKTIGTDAEQFRIYARILKEARTGCARRQLSACIIEGDLLAAEKKFSEAREVMQSGAVMAKSIVSRCDKGSEADQGACQDSRAHLAAFNQKSKAFYEAMLQSH